MHSVHASLQYITPLSFQDNVADDVIIRPWSCDWMDHLLTPVSYALVQPGISLVQVAYILIKWTNMFPLLWMNCVQSVFERSRESLKWSISTVYVVLNFFQMLYFLSVVLMWIRLVTMPLKICHCISELAYKIYTLMKTYVNNYFKIYSPCDFCGHCTFNVCLLKTSLLLFISDSDDIASLWQCRQDEGRNILALCPSVKQHAGRWRCASRRWRHRAGMCGDVAIQQKWVVQRNVIDVIILTALDAILAS